MYLSRTAAAMTKQSFSAAVFTSQLCWFRPSYLWHVSHAFLLQRQKLRNLGILPWTYAFVLGSIVDPGSPRISAAEQPWQPWLWLIQLLGTLLKACGKRPSLLQLLEISWDFHRGQAQEVDSPAQDNCCPILV